MSAFLVGSGSFRSYYVVFQQQQKLNEAKLYLLKAMLPACVRCRHKQCDSTVIIFKYLFATIEGWNGSSVARK